MVQGVIVKQGRSTTLILVFAAGLLLGMVTAPRLAAQFRVGNNRQLTKTDLPGCAGREVIIALNEFGPGTSGAHYHQGDSFTYVLEGSETYQVDGQPEVVVKAGDLLHEPPMKIHTVGNTDRVRLLVIRIQDKGVPDIMRVPGKR
jgi:quercetin dioxygenase-like cupin family protein